MQWRIHITCIFILYVCKSLVHKSVLWALSSCAARLYGLSHWTDRELMPYGLYLAKRFSPLHLVVANHQAELALALRRSLAWIFFNLSQAKIGSDHRFLYVFVVEEFWKIVIYTIGQFMSFYYTIRQLLLLR